MYDLLHPVLGDFTRSFIIYFQDILLLFVYFFVLTWYKKKRNGYSVRLIVSFLSCFGLGYSLALLSNTINSLPGTILCAAIMNLFVLAWLFFCYRESANELLLCFSGIIAAKNMAGRVFQLLVNLTGGDDRETMSFFPIRNELRDWLLFIAMHMVLLCCVYYFLRKKDNLQDPEYRFRPILLAIVTLFTSAVLASMANYYMKGSSIAAGVCLKMYKCLVYAFILVIRSNLLFHSKISQELRITEQLLHQEKKHYAEMKDNIELVNMKCHDIKRQLSSLQGRLTQEEVKALQEAVAIYDANIRTGSEIIDTILYEKQLFCEKNNISLKYLVDGKSLSFIQPTDLYSLISNALNNSIEAVLHLKDEELRLVDFTTFKDGRTLVIEVTNYFVPDMEVVSETSKEDKQHHGFGIRSMRYIAAMYHGVISASAEGNLFFLRMRFPIPDEEESFHQ